MENNDNMLPALSYKTLEEKACGDYLLKEAPERVLQFGEGNFLRGFIDCFIDVANEKTDFFGKVLAVSPRSGRMVPKFAKQDCLYTLYMRGINGGRSVSERRIISCISRCIDGSTDFNSVLAAALNTDLKIIVSNTTEAGIVFCEDDRYDSPETASFPGKLTRFLHERYLKTGLSSAPGFIILPCELIDRGGDELKACVLRYAAAWELDSSFAKWAASENTFCNTLVDRIVPGFPKDSAELDAQNGYHDELAVISEPFASFIIEGDSRVEQALPFNSAGLPVMVVPDCGPYKRRKVRILNGAHTSMTPVALLCGLGTVSECMQSAEMSAFVERAVYDEIIPTLDLAQNELTGFAASVFERFRNPYIRHELMSITLNSTSKWRTRVLPSVTDYFELRGRLPHLLVFSFAATAALFRSGAAISDSPDVLEFYAKNGKLPPLQFMEKLCEQRDFWGDRLTELAGFCTLAAQYLERIESVGAEAALKELQIGVDKQ